MYDLIDASLNFYGIIPARYDSKRFPGKPLADIKGKPMFWHVYNRAIQCSGFTNVVLATDDERILQKAKSLKVPVVMTRKDHPSGTDRVLEAADFLNIPKDAVVINIQGDEPVLCPEMLAELMEPFKKKPDLKIATLATRIDTKDANRPDQVKVVFAKDGKALYFSRSPIPYHQNQEKSVYYGHIGLYAFKMEALREFTSLGPGKLETTEKLEQLRLLEQGIPIFVKVTDHKSFGVDSPDDLKRVRGMAK